MAFNTITQFYVIDHNRIQHKITGYADLLPIIETYDMELPACITLKYCVKTTSRKRETGKNLSPCIIEPEGRVIKTFTFFVANKLQTATDIRAYLMEKYGSVFDFYPLGDAKQHAVLKNVYDNETFRLRNEETGAPIYLSTKQVDWQYLVYPDIVVNNKMEQLWPKATKTVPVEIQNFFWVKTK